MRSLSKLEERLEKVMIQKNSDLVGKFFYTDDALWDVQSVAWNSHLGDFYCMCKCQKHGDKQFQLDETRNLVKKFNGIEDIPDLLFDDDDTLYSQEKLYT